MFIQQIVLVQLVGGCWRVSRMVEIFEFLPDGLIDVAVTQSSSSVNGVIVDTQAYAGPWIYNNGNKTAVT